MHSRPRRIGVGKRSAREKTRDMDFQFIVWLAMLAAALLHLGKVLAIGRGRGYF